jgi:hypothetical protein
LKAQRLGCGFPPYAVALQRVERRAEQINRMIASGVRLHDLPLGFWSDVFAIDGGGSSSAARLRNGVQDTLRRARAAPTFCGGCFRSGLVLVDCGHDGGARGWLCEQCSAVVSACDDPAILRKLAKYLVKSLSHKKQRHEAKSAA